MKNVKKLLAIVLAAAMVFAFSVTAFADDTTTSDTGSITISNATVNETYTIYKIFDANPSGTEDLIAYTATADVKTWLESDASGLFTFTENTAGTYNVEAAEGKEDDIITFLKGLVTEDGVDDNLTTLNLQQGNAITATSATVTFSGIPYGYYLVQSSLGTTVSVDSTNKDVTIIDKNQGPTWDIDEDGTGKAIVVTGDDGDEYVTENSANYGDTINYIIGVNTTNYVGEEQVTHYYVQDTLDAGLKYVATEGVVNVVVKVGNKTLDEDTDYSVEMQNEGQGFEITVPWLDEDGNCLYAANDKLKVTYSATVTDKAALYGDSDTDNEDADAPTGNKNTANFTYATKEPGEDTPETPNKEDYDEENEKTTTTYVFALGILKVAPATVAEDGTVTENPLSGAKFTVTDSKGNAVKVSAVSGSDGVYKYDSTVTTNTVVSPASGIIIIKGLAEGTYTLTETVAPEGYNLLTEAVEVTTAIAESTTYTTKITTYYDEKGNVVSTATNATAKETSTSFNVVPVTIQNNAGSELPETGGMGTTIFYMVGAILVIGAGVVMITRRRMDVQ